MQKITLENWKTEKLSSLENLSKTNKTIQVFCKENKIDFNKVQIRRINNSMKIWLQWYDVIAYGEEFNNGELEYYLFVLEKAV